MLHARSTAAACEAVRRSVVSEMINDGVVSNRNAKERRPDSQQLTRQWALLRLLSDATQPYSVKQLAEQLTTSKATIERDLATLERDFAVVEETVGKQKKVYRIDHKVRALETVTFGTSELLAIYAASAALTSLSGTPMHEDLRSVQHKIRGFLSPRHNGGLDALSRVFTSHARGHVDYEPQREQIDDLVDAIARRRVCELTYFAPTKGTTRTHRTRPLRLVWHRNTLYLLACLGDHQRITTLAVHRVRSLELTDETFVAPRIDVDAHVARAFGIFVADQEEEVEILFDAEVAWKIEERTFHPNEEKQREPDGRLRYRVRSSAQWEVIPWVQTFGPFAELVSPRSWRESLRSSVAGMLERYTAPTPDLVKRH
jgi:predicted DNA-binding transcriptional regulator YafY